MIRQVGALTAFACLSAGWSFAAQADDTIKYRAVFHSASQQSQDVGDAEGHGLALTKFSGLASFPDGSFGTTYFVAALDFTKGNGPVLTTYGNLTLNDGSVLWFRGSGATTPKSGNGLQNNDIKGTGTILSGTGKYAGAKGDVTFSGGRVGAFGAPSVDIYLDYVMSLKQ